MQPFTLIPQPYLPAQCNLPKKPMQRLSGLFRYYESWSRDTVAVAPLVR